MEKARMIALLEKYWQAETTIGEEQALAEYFRSHDELDPELAPYRDLFLYFGQEAQVSAGPDFGNRILQHVGLSVPPTRMFRVGFRVGFIAAAAAICAIVMGIFLLTPAVKQTPPAVASAGGNSPAVIATTVPDTYDDPGQALAAVRHALLIASTHLNEGRRSFAGVKK